MRLHRFGLLDVLSIYTALRDWDMAIAAKETTSAVEYPLARAILDAYLSLPVERDYTYVEIAKLLLHSGFVVSMYGDGRPESGSEHIIAKVVERNVECLHAHSVALGILVSMQLQGSWSDDIAARAKHIPDWETPRGATVLAQIEERISSASIKARPGRYTVLDTSSPNEIDRAISRALLFLRS